MRGRRLGQHDQLLHDPGLAQELGVDAVDLRAERGEGRDGRLDRSRDRRVDRSFEQVGDDPHTQA